MFNTNCYGNENIPSYSQGVETPWAAHTTHNSQGIFQEHPGAANGNAFVGYSLGQVQSKELDLAGVVGMKETTTASASSNAWHHSHRMRYPSATANRGFLPYQMPSLPHYDTQTVDTSHLAHTAHHQPFWMPTANPNAYSLMGASYQRNPNTAYVDRGDTSRSTAALRHNTAMPSRNYAVEEQSRTVNASMQQQSAQVLPQHCQRQSRQQIHQLQQHQHQHQQLQHQQDYLRNQMTQRDRDPCQYPTNTYHQESMRVGMDSALYHNQHLIPTAQHQHQQYQASQEGLRKASENERRTAFTSRQTCFPQAWAKPTYVPYDTSQAFLSNHRSSASAFQPCNKQVDSNLYSMDSIWAKTAVATAASHVPHTPTHSTIPTSNNQLSWLHDSTSHLKANMYHAPQEVKQVTNVASNFSANVLNLDTGQVELSMSMVPPEFPMYPQTVAPPQPQRHRSSASHAEPPAMQPPPHRSLPVPPIPVSQSKSQPPPAQLKPVQQAKPTATARAAGLDVRQFLATWDEDLDLATPRPACVDVDEPEPEEPQQPTSLVVLDCQNVPSEQAAGLLHMYPSLQLSGNDMQSVVLLDNGLSSTTASGKHNLDFLLSRAIPTSGSTEQTVPLHYEKVQAASDVPAKEPPSAINVVQSPALQNIPAAQPQVPPTVEKEPEASPCQNVAQSTNAVEAQMDIISQPRSQEATTPASLCESDSEKSRKSSLRHFRKRKAASAVESDASESQCSETAEEVITKSMKHSENDLQCKGPATWFENDSMDTIDGPVRTPISVSSATCDLSPPMEAGEKIGNEENRNLQTTQALPENSRQVKRSFDIYDRKDDLQERCYKSMPDISENGPDISASPDVESTMPNDSNSAPATNSIPNDSNSASTANSIPSDPNKAPTTGSIPSDPNNALTTSSIPSDPNNASTTSSIPSYPNNASTTSSIPSDPNNASTTSSTQTDPNNASTTSSILNDPNNASTTSSIPSNPNNASTTSSIPSDPNNASTTSSIPSDPNNASTTSSIPSDPNNASTTSSTPSDPNNASTTSSISNDPNNASTISSTPSDPNKASTTSSTPSDPNKASTTSSIPSDPNSAPTTRESIKSPISQDQSSAEITLSATGLAPKEPTENEPEPQVTSTKYLSRIVGSAPGKIPKILLSRLRDVREKNRRRNGVKRKLPSIRLTRVKQTAASLSGDEVPEYTCSEKEDSQEDSPCDSRTASEDILDEDGDEPQEPALCRDGVLVNTSSYLKTTVPQNDLNGSCAQYNSMSPKTEGPIDLSVNDSNTAKCLKESLPPAVNESSSNAKAEDQAVSLLQVPVTDAAQAELQQKENSEATLLETEKSDNQSVSLRQVPVADAAQVPSEKDGNSEARFSETEEFENHGVSDLRVPITEAAQGLSRNDGHSEATRPQTEEFENRGVSLLQIPVTDAAQAGSEKNGNSTRSKTEEFLSTNETDSTLDAVPAVASEHISDGNKETSLSPNEAPCVDSCSYFESTPLTSNDQPKSDRKQLPSTPIFVATTEDDLVPCPLSDRPDDESAEADHLHENDIAHKKRTSDSSPPHTDDLSGESSKPLSVCDPAEISSGELCDKKLGSPVAETNRPKSPAVACNSEGNGRLANPWLSSCVEDKVKPVKDVEPTQARDAVGGVDVVTFVQESLEKSQNKILDSNPPVEMEVEPLDSKQTKTIDNDTEDHQPTERTERDLSDCNSCERIESEHLDSAGDEKMDSKLLDSAGVERMESEPSDSAAGVEEIECEPSDSAAGAETESDHSRIKQSEKMENELLNNRTVGIIQSKLVDDNEPSECTNRKNDSSEPEAQSGYLNIQTKKGSVVDNDLSLHQRVSPVSSPEAVDQPSDGIKEPPKSCESIFSLDNQQPTESNARSSELFNQPRNVEDQDSKDKSDDTKNETNNLADQTVSPQNAPPVSPQEEQSTGHGDDRSESSSEGDESSDSSDKSSVCSSDETETSGESCSEAASATESGASSDEDDSESDEESERADGSDEDSSDDRTDTPTKSPDVVEEGDKKSDLDTESTSQPDEDTRTDVSKHDASPDAEDSSVEDSDMDAEDSTLSPETPRSPVCEGRTEEDGVRCEDAAAYSSGETASDVPTDEKSDCNVNLEAVENPPEKTLSTCYNSVPSDENITEASSVIDDVSMTNEQSGISAEHIIADAASSLHHESSLVFSKSDGSVADGGNIFGSSETLSQGACQSLSPAVHDALDVSTDLCNGHTSPKACHLGTPKSPQICAATSTQSPTADEPDGGCSPKSVNGTYMPKSPENGSSVIHPVDSCTTEESQVSKPTAGNYLITSQTSDAICPTPKPIERSHESNVDIPLLDRASVAVDASSLEEKTDLHPEILDQVEIVASGNDFVVEEEAVVVYTECSSSLEVAGNVLIECETEEVRRSQEDGLDISDCSSRQSALSDGVEEEGNNESVHERDVGKEDGFEDCTDVEDEAEYEKDDDGGLPELNGVTVSAEYEEEDEEFMDDDEFIEEIIKEENEDFEEEVNDDLGDVEFVQETVDTEFSEHHNAECDDVCEFVQGIPEDRTTVVDRIAREKGEFVQDLLLESSETRVFVNGADGEGNVYVRDDTSEDFHAVVYQHKSIDQMEADESARDNCAGNVDFGNGNNVCGTVQGECIEVVEFEYDGLCDENMEVYCTDLEGDKCADDAIEICEEIVNEEEGTCSNPVCTENEVECHVNSGEQLYFCDGETYTIETNTASIEETSGESQVACEVGREEVCEPWSGVVQDVVPVPTESVQNWPYVEEILEGATDATPQWTPEKVRPRVPLQMKCSLSWDRILNEGQGLVLGRANVQVRVPGDSSRRTTHWKVVTRERRRASVTSSTTSSCVEENNNVMPDVKGPIVVVKRLVLKRPRTRRSQRNSKRPGTETPPEEDCNPWIVENPECPRLSTLKTKGALKAYQSKTDSPKASSFHCRTRNRSWPSTAKDLNLANAEAPLKRRKSEVDPPSQLPSECNGLSPQRLPKVIIKRTGEGPLYESFICEKDRVVMQPVVCLERNVELDNLALTLGSEGVTPAESECGQSPPHSDLKDNRLEGNTIDRQSELSSRNEADRRSRRKPAKVRRVGQLMKVVELLQQWRQAEQAAATRTQESEPILEAECDTVENNNSLLCVDNNTDDENHELHLLQPLKYLAAMQDKSATPPQSSNENSNAPSRAASRAGSFTNLETEETSYERESSGESASLEEGVRNDSRRSGGCMSECSEGSESACRSRSASLEDLGSPLTCQACGYCAGDPDEQFDHIKTHPYHCQRCQQAFLSQEGFKDHLLAEHPSTEEHHHCLLCQRTFPDSDRYDQHRKGWHHCLMERSQRHTIHSLYRLFTGSDCPHLPSLQPEELQALDWLPSDPDGIHFYHDATPLQLAIQDCNLNLSKGAAESEETSS